jgi:hypothetical protein
MTSKAIAENQTLSDIELIRDRFKKTIILSILFFVSGVVVAVVGIGVNRRPALYIGSTLALIGLSGLLRVKFQMRQILRQNEEKREFYRKYSKRS